MGGQVIAVKIGGATLGSHDTTIEDLVSLQQQGVSPVVVHGGGKLITAWLEKQGIPSRFVRGERATDRATLEVVAAVLCGLVNKEITAAVNNLGGKAIGLSGIDGAIIETKTKDSELGYVGAVLKVNAAPIQLLLQGGYIPVIAPLGLHASGRAEGEPQILNINADVVAGEIAAATGAGRLIFLTDVDGVRDSSGGLLPHLSAREAKALVESGVAAGGMIPKINASLRALSTVPTTCIIDGRQPHALLRHIEGQASGTVIDS